MQIGNVGMHSMQQAIQQQTQVAQAPRNQALDNDGDTDHGAPDGARGQHIDVKA